MYFLNTIIKFHSLKATNFTHSNAKYSEIDLRVRALLSAAKALNFLAKSLTELESCFIFLLRIRERKKKSWLDCLLHLFHFSSLQEFQGFLLQHWWFFGLWFTALVFFLKLLLKNNSSTRYVQKWKTKKKGLTFLNSHYWKYPLHAQWWYFEKNIYIILVCVLTGSSSIVDGHWFHSH